MKITGFDMLEKLGEGGMATVWKARQVSLDRTVAIKCLSTQYSSDEADVKRFQTEAQSAAKLKHPGIVQVYDASYGDGAYYFIMEYVAGYTVGDWIRRKGAISEKEALVVAECVADALGYAWEREHIIHCDIKPDNVMIDEDGTVKVADLGLARTISAVAGEATTDEVMGTPAYMSPEQATGSADMDCRADIYSLGAMLYYLVTGELLFKEHSEESSMKLQVSGTVQDPLRVNPEVSKAMRCLLEKMLAKDREDRQKDWNEVSKDFARVKRGLFPLKRLPQGAASTIEKTRATGKTSSAGPVVSPVEQKKADLLPLKVALIALGAIVLIAGVVLLSRKGSQPVRAGRPVQYRPPVTLPPDPQVAKAERMYNSAKAWAAENPQEYDEAIRRYREVMEETWGTEYAEKARAEMKRLSREKRDEVMGVLKELENQVSAFVEAGDFERAVAFYREYSGPFAEESEQERRSAASRLRMRADKLRREEEERQRVAEQKFSSFMTSVAAAVLERGVEAGAAETRAAIKDPEMKPVADTAAEVRDLLRNSASVSDRILESFKKDAGRSVTVELKRGKKRVEVQKVLAGRVYARQKIGIGNAVSEISFGVDDLSLRERLKRMETMDESCAALMKGLMAYSSGAFSHARRYFGGMKSPLGKYLVSYIDDRMAESMEEEAEKALRYLLGSVGMKVDEFNPGEWAGNIKLADFSPKAAERCSTGAERYREMYGGTRFARRAEPVLEALETVKTEAPEPEKPERPAPKTIEPPEVSLLSELKAIEGNADAVRNLLLQRNPALTGENISMETDEAGKVTELRIRGTGLRDIGPVAALTDLKSFDYSGETELGIEEQGILKDISSLRGLALTELRVSNCRIYNIDVLNRMPLNMVNLSHTAVRNLSALEGLPIEHLNLRGTKITSILQLGGLSLKYLNLADTDVRRLRPLGGMPLTHLVLSKIKAYDFTALKQLEKVRILNVNGTQFGDIGLLEGMPLKQLHARETKVQDISGLAEFKELECLDISGTRVSDFASLRQLPLKELYMHNTRFSDMNILNGKKLERLDIGETRVDSLWALRGMPLRFLNIEKTGVDDLSSLKECPLEELWCRGIKTTDYAPLYGLPLRELWIDVSSPEIAMRFQKLRYLNGVDLLQERLRRLNRRAR
ncbi:MAG: protein kinase [Kiritimatiellia bacterium]